MSTALLDAVVKKNRVRLIPFMLALYVLAWRMIIWSISVRHLSTTQIT
ncbi:inner membrane transport RhmT domain protein, partial [Escherichia coli 97.1742]